MLPTPRRSVRDNRDQGRPTTVMGSTGRRLGPRIVSTLDFPLKRMDNFKLADLYDILEGLPAEMISMLPTPLVTRIAEHVGAGGKLERRKALSVLWKLPGELTGTLPTSLVKKIAERVRARDELERRMALGILWKLPGELTNTLPACLVTRIAERVRDGDELERRMALRALGNVSSELASRLPMPLMTGIVERVADGDEHERWAAFGILVKLPVKLANTLPACLVTSIAERVRDGSEHERRMALGVLVELPVELGLPTPVVTCIAECVRDGGEHERRMAVNVLGKVPAHLMSTLPDPLVTSFAECAQSTDESLRRPILDVIAKLEPRMLARYCASGGNTLHIAAASGHLKACRVLVAAGSPIGMYDSSGLMPEDLAKKHGHSDVFDYLTSLRSICLARGGSGDAFSVAMHDRRTISQVNWYTIDLPGIAGKLGLQHSLLAIFVGEGREQHGYVIEKAASTSSIEAFKNGVYISHWSDVSTSVVRCPWRRLGMEHIGHIFAGSAGFTMESLRNLAVELGPYNVGTCNCHHAALAIYNACAKSDFREHAMPNPISTRLAAGLQSVGLDVSNFESTLSRSDSVAAVSLSQSNLDSSHDKAGIFPIDSQDAHLDRRALIAAQLAAWIYAPQGAIGDRMDHSLTLHNETAEDLVLFVEETKARLHLLPGGHGDFEVPVNQVHVRINRPGFFFGLTSRRTRLARVEVERGCSYRVKLDVDGGVTCLRCDPLPEQACVRHLDFAAGNRLVQWALVVVEKTAYVVFKGTSSALDTVIDVGALTYDDADHGLRVHSSMWVALTQREHHVINVIAEQLHKELAEGHKDVVVCGHSLGGGYAILSTLQLLHVCVKVDQVFVFGAPQVVVPPMDRTPVWHALDNITQSFVNSYDVVPRAPSCVEYLREALPHCLAKSIGCVRFCVDPRAKFNQMVARHEDVLRKYQPIGTLTLISRNSRFLQRVHEQGHEGPARLEVLRSMPQPFGAFVIAQHNCADYVSILSRLAAAAR